MSLDRDGFVLVREAIDAETVFRLIEALKHGNIARAKRDGDTFGARGLLAMAEIRAIAPPPGMRTVRGLFFDKTAKANWPVPWHRDLTLALKERREMEGWTNWTLKRGVPHVQAPKAVLSRMVTLRLHLDDCGEDNGPLRVIPKSHVEEGATGPETVVTARAGDALWMKPLLLHASSPARDPSHRRVLHLEFAPPDLLPEGLDWALV
jgi:hypothetical protein